MASQRTHIVLPEDLIAQIDSLVGPRGRSSFLVETARAELERRRLLDFLRSDAPAWLDKNHPELRPRSGASTLVRKLRRESDTRTAPGKRRA